MRQLSDFQNLEVSFRIIETKWYTEDRWSQFIIISLINIIIPHSF